MTFPDWSGVQADTPEFHDKVAQAIAMLDRPKDAPLYSLEAIVGFRLRLAFEREFHRRGGCSKYGYVWARP